MPTTIALLHTPLLHTGGVETHLLSLLRCGDSTRYRWLVVAPASPTFAAKVQALGGQVVSWQPAHQLDIVALVRLLRLLRVHRVNLVHAHSPRAALFGRVAARLLGLPIVVTVHLPAYEYVYGPGFRARYKRWLYRRVERILNHRLTDHLIYVSSHIAQEAVNRGLVPPWRATVIENGIDLSLFVDRGQRVAIRQALAVSPETTVLCCVGRLTEQKGIDVLLKALYVLEPLGRDWALWLAGDGPQQAALEVQARQLGLEGRVRFLGFRDDVPDLLMGSDIFVLPSRYEAMPIGILEAMAAGLLCVVTGVGENAELVEDGVAGYVVPPEDPSALAAALRNLIGDPAKCRAMGDAGRQKARLYSVERMVARTLAVYEQVLQ